MASKKKTAQTRKRSRPTEPKKASFNTNYLIIIVVAIAIICIGIYFLTANPSGNNNENNNPPSTGNPVAVIDTSMGTIKVELFKDKAPNTVNNFIDYVNDGFYDGLVFHRVMDDFMIQGGGFYPDGTQKQTNDPIDLEIHEDLKHVDGAIAMARTSNPNSATSQFFINDGPQPSLEPGGVDQYGYAVFGVVTEDIDVVRLIASVDTDLKHTYHQNWPVEDVIINSITIE